MVQARILSMETRRSFKGLKVAGIVTAFSLVAFGVYEFIQPVPIIGVPISPLRAPSIFAAGGSSEPDKAEISLTSSAGVTKADMQISAPQEIADAAPKMSSNEKYACESLWYSKRYYESFQNTHTDPVKKYFYLMRINPDHRTLLTGKDHAFDALNTEYVPPFWTEIADPAEAAAVQAVRLAIQQHQGDYVSLWQDFDNSFYFEEKISDLIPSRDSIALNAFIQAYGVYLAFSVAPSKNSLQGKMYYSALNVLRSLDQQKDIWPVLGITEEIAVSVSKIAREEAFRKWSEEEGYITNAQYRFQHNAPC